MIEATWPAELAAELGGHTLLRVTVIDSALADAFMRHLDDFDHQGITAEDPTPVMQTSHLLKLDWGLVYDGGNAGQASRQLLADSNGYAVEHLHLRKEPAVTVRGLGLALWRHALGKYKEMGVGRVELLAWGTGAYLWTYTDLEFSDPSGSSSLLAHPDVRKALADAEKWFPPEQVDRFRAHGSSARTPRALAALDRKLARCVLSRGSWRGEQMLLPPESGRQPAGQVTA